MKKVICMLLAVLVLTGAACAETPGTQLGFDALKLLYDGRSNQVISPLSLAYALAMTADGAEGETRQEMLDALGAEDADAVAGIQQALEDAGLRQANAAFLPGMIEPKAEYVRRLKEAFGAKWFEPEDSDAENINRWVEDKTDGMIPQIVDTLPGDVQLVLLNAIAMDAKWETRFDPNDNTEGMFHAPDGDAEVTFMNNEFYVDYGERENVQMIRLNYRDCGLSMLIALPEAGEMDAVLDGLCAEGLGYFVFGEEHVNVKITMPKADISVGNNMKDVLSQLGVKTAFSDSADFSGITDEMLLKIDSVVQKARLILDEAGTRAAAATMVSVKCYGAMMPVEVIRFRMDRPFAFAIVHEESGAVCFAGIVADPTAN